MRLFLASQELGNFGSKLRELVGDNSKALVISNTRDYYLDEARISNAVQEMGDVLAKNKIGAERLDLRKFFGKATELKKYIEDYEPGLIFSIGGNVYCLATALHESGMDEIIKDGVHDDKFVYGGESAGAMIAAHRLGLYEVKDEVSSDRVQATYGITPCMVGLDFSEVYVVPHANREERTAVTQTRIRQNEAVGEQPI